MFAQFRLLEPTRERCQKTKHKTETNSSRATLKNRQSDVARVQHRMKDTQHCLLQLRNIVRTRVFCAFRAHEFSSASRHSIHCWACRPLYRDTNSVSSLLVVKATNSFTFNLYERDSSVIWDVSRCPTQSAGIKPPSVLQAPYSIAAIPSSIASSVSEWFLHNLVVRFDRFCCETENRPRQSHSHRSRSWTFLSELS